MGIKSKCNKCANYNYCKHIESLDCRSYCGDFKYGVPKEEEVRQEERNKFITLLKSDLENHKGLCDNYLEADAFGNIKEVLECCSVINYIEQTIELLEKEK